QHLSISLLASVAKTGQLSKSPPAAMQFGENHA
ncbi:hypothetical protein F441_12854, partial [Phytophthora nicotianae CJ01A1]